MQLRQARPRPVRYCLGRFGGFENYTNPKRQVRPFDGALQVGLVFDGLFGSPSYTETLPVQTNWFGPNFNSNDIERFGEVKEFEKFFGTEDRPGVLPNVFGNVPARTEALLQVFSDITEPTVEELYYGLKNFYEALVEEVGGKDNLPIIGYTIRPRYKNVRAKDPETGEDLVNEEGKAVWHAERTQYDELGYVTVISSDDDAKTQKNFERFVKTFNKHFTSFAEGEDKYTDDAEMAFDPNKIG